MIFEKGLPEIRERFMWRNFSKVLRELWEAIRENGGSYRPDLYYMRGSVWLGPGFRLVQLCYAVECAGERPRQTVFLTRTMLV
jgi:hypothetical protein